MCSEGDTDCILACDWGEEGEDEGYGDQDSEDRV
jgi:hypothetical protein